MAAAIAFRVSDEVLHEVLARLDADLRAPACAFRDEFC